MFDGCQRSDPEQAERVRWDPSKETLDAAGDALEEEPRASEHSRGAGIGIGAGD